MTRILIAFTSLFLLLLPSMAHAFCGFYVAKADTKLFNKASKVVLARSDDRTVITMANDFQGDVKDFAIVVPVPTVVTKTQVNVADNRIIDHLDAYTAPRLVEYFDSNPCQQYDRHMIMESSMALMEAKDDSAGAGARAKSLGVTIEEEYSVGEYDILVLSAKQSGGLLTFLNGEGYKLPDGAKKTLKSYIKQDMKFFVAKVNLEAFEKTGFTYLRPLQVAYEHEKFMLPIRLGTLNANGPQDIILFTLTKNGRVEPSNYRTVKIPSNEDVPLFIEERFGDFYKSMFDVASKKEGLKAVFLEYAWDMGWCDPCAADPLPNEDLRTLGVWWLDAPQIQKPGRPRIMPSPQGAQNVFVTRLHARYTAETFPEDIMLSETSDRENFQGRYVLRHPFSGVAECKGAEDYYSGLPKRFEKEAKTLANITGWDIGKIRSDMEGNGQSFKMKATSPSGDWWEKMWGSE